MLGSKKIPLIHRQSTVGRNPNGTIYIEEPSIAKEHTLIIFNENFEEPTLVDRGSVSGCKVNQKQIPKNSKKKLYSGDFIKFGNYPLEYQFFSNSTADGDFSRESIVIEEKIKLAPDSKNRYARIDHLGDLS